MNLISNLQSCSQFISQNEDVLSLVYYSHIPSAIVSLLFGLFVFLKNRKEYAGKIFFAMASLFSFWSFFDVIIWTSIDSRKTMFFWSLINIVENLVTCTTLYFAYFFIEKKDISFRAKAFFSALFLPYIFLIPTSFNMTGFDVTTCEAKQGALINYFYFLEILFFIILLSYLVRKIFTIKGEEKGKTLYFSIGIILFLASFSGANIAGSLAVIINPANPDNWKILQYGLFGMPIFTGFLAYLIVRYHAFSIKLIGAQALVVSMILLVASQFFFAQNSTAIVLTGVTLALSIGFGFMLIISVKEEVERKEQLQSMADKLATANDQLRKLDNAKTEFISIASHQLRTPITAIKGFASLLLEGSYGELTGSVHGALEKIYDSSQRLVNLIEDLLNVSRIESGRMQFTFEKASVEKLIKELNDNFILIAKTKNFFLNLNLPEVPLPEIVMDYTKIRELVSNFIDNGLKYTEKGGVTVSAELRECGVLIDENGFVIEGKKSEFGKVIRISVSDTGIGIPKEEIPYLFKKFSRGKDVSRLHVGGTGLGLYVGKAIADAHHGQVWVESEGDGKGSCFIIEIPVEHVV